MGERPGTTRLRTLVGNHARLAPIARLLGASVLAVEDGRVTVKAESRHTTTTITPASQVQGQAFPSGTLTLKDGTTVLGGDDKTDLGLLIRQLRMNQERVKARIGGDER